MKATNTFLITFLVVFTGFIGAAKGQTYSLLSIDPTAEVVNERPKRFPEQLVTFQFSGKLGTMYTIAPQNSTLPYRRPHRA